MVHGPTKPNLVPAMESRLQLRLQEPSRPSDNDGTLGSPRLEEALNKKIDMSHLAGRIGKVNVLILNEDGSHEYGMSLGRDDLLAAARSEQAHFDAFLASCTGGAGTGANVTPEASHVSDTKKAPSSPDLSPGLFGRTRSGSGAERRYPTRRPNYHPTTSSRDVRKILSHLSMVQSQSVMSRLGAVLMSFVCPAPLNTVDIAHGLEATTQKIAAIVTVHKCTIIIPPGADSLLSSFTQKLRVSLVETEAIPFEFRAIESVLETVCEMYQQQVGVFESFMDERLPDNVTGDKKTIYWLKRAILEVKTQSDATLRVLNEVLENDMDMAMMYLTKLYLEPEHLLDADLPLQHEEMETMLETYLDSMRATCNRLQLVERELELREDQLELSLDERRNKLLFADIVISIVGILFSFVAAIAGLFGMNLFSGLEDDPTAFNWVSVTLGVIVILVMIVVSVSFKYLLT